MSNLKDNVLNALNMLSQLETNQWKSRAYKNAYYTISNLTEEDIKIRSKFSDLPGIGKGISDKIIEYRDTGKIDKLIVLMAERGKDFPESMYKVRKGYTSKRIQLYQAQKIVKDLGIKESDNLMLVGSYRRKSSNIADIDLLAFTNGVYWSEVGRLSELPECTLLISGDKKTSFRYNNPELTQIDVNNGSEGNKWCQLLHHTGSKESNIRLRGIAKSKGLTLNQYYLEGWKGIIRSEQDIFNALDVPYVKPEDR